MPVQSRTSWMAAANSLWTSRLRPWMCRMKSSRCSHCSKTRKGKAGAGVSYVCSQSWTLSFPPLLTCTDAPSNSRRMPSSSSTASSAGHKPQGVNKEGEGVATGRGGGREHLKRDQTPKSGGLGLATGSAAAAPPGGRGVERYERGLSAAGGGGGGGVLTGSASPS